MGVGQRRSTVMMMMMMKMKMMMVMRAMLMFICFLMINAQSTTDLDIKDTLTADQCTQGYQDFIQSLLLPQQRDIHMAVGILEDTSRQMRQVVNTSQTLESELASTRELLKQVKDSVDSISARVTMTTLPESTAVCGDEKQQLVSALTKRCIPLLIQQNVDGSDFFNRSWEEFKEGFNDTNGNYWLGNELLSQLTLTRRYKLRFDLQSRANQSNWYVAEYSTFTVENESSNYTLHVAGFSGNAGYDAFGLSNGMMFTTYDRDNDRWTASQYTEYSDYNCAVFKGGGFWYEACAVCNVNSDRSREHGFSWYGLPGGQYLQSSRMWLQCR